MYIEVVFVGDQWKLNACFWGLERPKKMELVLTSC